jgi:hypothetical protein
MTVLAVHVVMTVLAVHVVMTVLAVHVVMTVPTVTVAVSTADVITPVGSPAGERIGGCVGVAAAGARAVVVVRVRLHETHGGTPTPLQPLPLYLLRPAATRLQVHSSDITADAASNSGSIKPIPGI